MSRALDAVVPPALVELLDAEPGAEGTAILVLTVGCEQPALPQLPPDPRVAKSAPPSPPEQIEPQPVLTLTPERQRQLRLLDGARRRWQGTSPRHYRLVVSRECFCDAGTPFESEVVRGRVTTAAGGVRRSGLMLTPELRTVEMLFTEAERLLRSNAEDVQVVFDDQWAFPSAIAVDRWRGASDDEWTWRAALTVVE